MKYNKSIGDNNTNSANDIAAHNRFNINFDGPAILVVVLFILALLVAALIYLVINFSGLVVIAIVGGFSLIMAALVVSAVGILVSALIRHTSTTKAQFHIDRNQEEWSRYVYSIGNHTVVRDPVTRILSVHDTTVVQETRHFPAMIEAPPNPTEGILTMWDKGLSGRAIEKAMDKKVPYRDIVKTLDMYRPGWNIKPDVGSEESM